MARLPGGPFVMVDTPDDLSSPAEVRVSATPWGPWSAPAAVSIPGWTDTGSSPNYQLVVHPELDTATQLVLSYATLNGQLRFVGLPTAGLPPPPGPVVSSVWPATGTTGGGEPVALAGAGFTGATAVDFGPTPATVTGCTDTVCDVTAPPGVAGTVPVTVTTPAGTSAASSAFTYGTPTYHPVAPTRICDTRSGGTRAACPAGRTLGPGGVLTVDAGGPEGSRPPGRPRWWPTSPPPTRRAGATSPPFPRSARAGDLVLNWSAGQTVPDLVTVALSSEGTFEVANASGSVDVVVDVEGYTALGPAGAGLYEALAEPQRICDTRPGNPSGLSGTALTQCVGLAPDPPAVPCPSGSTGWAAFRRRGWGRWSWRSRPPTPRARDT